MEKHLIKTKEDFIEWKNYCKDVIFDHVHFVARNEKEPKEYPCVLFSHEEQYCKGSYLYLLHYHFAYPSDFVA